jgi:hypothetical protein
MHLTLPRLMLLLLLLLLLLPPPPPLFSFSSPPSQASAFAALVNRRQIQRIRFDAQGKLQP